MHFPLAPHLLVKLQILEYRSPNVTTHHQKFITGRVCNSHNYGFYTQPSGYAQQVLMKPFQVLVCIGNVNSIKSLPLYCCVSTFTADCLYVILYKWRVQKPYGRELHTLPVINSCSPQKQQITPPFPNYALEVQPLYCSCSKQSCMMYFSCINMHYTYYIEKHHHVHQCQPSVSQDCCSGMLYHCVSAPGLYTHYTYVFVYICIYIYICGFLLVQQHTHSQQLQAWIQLSRKYNYPNIQTNKKYLFHFFDNYKHLYAVVISILQQSGSLLHFNYAKN